MTEQSTTRIAGLQIQAGLTIVAGLVSLLAAFAGSVEVIHAKGIWPRPLLPPEPAWVAGVANPVVSLNGTWKWTKDPPDHFFANSVDPSNWSDVTVPGDLVKQGLMVESDTVDRDVEYPYKKAVAIPADFGGKRILLRFDGAYNYVRVWVNGMLVRSHRGAFTTWDADITDLVTPGQPAWITIGVTAETRAIEYRHTRGITRDLLLLALPQNYAMRLHAETRFDESNTNATLRVDTGVVFYGGTHATVKLALRTPSGANVAISPSSLYVTAANPEASVDIPITAPAKWDAEHPRLYTLTASYIIDGVVVETVRRRIGFRKVDVRGNRMYVNGKPVKLRGVNWHQVDAHLGIVQNDEADAEIMRMIKSANVNYVRTSHMPQTNRVLDMADELGLYVEQEASVFFICSGVACGSQEDPEYTAAYMDEFAEMLERDKSRASIVIWSLGNESRWGVNVRRMWDYLKQEDPSRPAKWSWPHGGPEPQYDLYSWHYPETAASLGTRAIPEIYDEMAHGYSGTASRAKFQQDPGLHSWYGWNAKQWWDKIFPVDGALGGALWHAQDVVFEPVNTSDNAKGLGQWGTLFDQWGREKPEYYLVKKAFSPVRIADEPLASPGKDRPLAIPVENRFDHTNLRELTINWEVGASSGTVAPDIPPHTTGALTLPPRAWKLGDVVHLLFRLVDGIVIDEYRLPIGAPVVTFPAVQSPAPTISQDASSITVSGREFELIFAKASGQITSGTYRGSVLLTGGPELNLGLARLSPWSLDQITSSTQGKEAVITITGSHGPLSVRYQVRIDGAGRIATTYALGGAIPDGYTEVGVAYMVTGAVDRLTWSRAGLWSVYPNGHIDRLDGTATVRRSGPASAYGVKPTWTWSQDDVDYYLFGRGDSGGRGTNDFRSSKTGMYYASLVLADSTKRVRAEGDGAGSVRAALVGSDIRYNINNLWSAVHLGPVCCDPGANFVKTITVSPGFVGTVVIRLTDSDAVSTTYTDNVDKPVVTAPPGTVGPSVDVTIVPDMPVLDSTIDQDDTSARDPLPGTRARPARVTSRSYCVLLATTLGGGAPNERKERLAERTDEQPLQRQQG